MSSPTLPSDVARRSLAREHGLLTAPRIGARAAHGGPARSRGSALHPVPCASEAPDAHRWAGLVEYAVRMAGRLDDLAQVRHVLATVECDCAPGASGCVRHVLHDILHTSDPCSDTGLAMGLTVRRPWASLLLVSSQIGGKNVENRTDSTDYRGPVLIYGGTRIDQAGIELGQRLGMREMSFHCDQQGWLGASVLVDVHRAQGCCAPWGTTPFNPGQPKYHWVFESPARLAARPWHDNAKGFDRLRPVSWSALVSRKAARHARLQGDTGASR